MKPKPLFRVVAFDDGFFPARRSGSALLVGVVWRADNRIDGVLSTRIQVDGNDATRKISSLLNNSRFAGQASYILLQGMTFAGFNLVDMKSLSRRTGKPVIAVFRQKPGKRKMADAIRKFHSAEKTRALESAPKINPLGNIKFQFCGCGKAEAMRVIKKCLHHSSLPEPVRIAHLIASGASIGQSTPP